MVAAKEYLTNCSMLRTGKEMNDPSQSSGTLKRRMLKTGKMNIDNLFYKTPSLRKVYKISKRTKTRKKSNKKQLEAGKTFTERMDSYNIISSLSEENADIIIGQLLRNNEK